MQLSKKMLKISPSGTVILAQKARQLKAEGKDIIELGEGEPDFNTPKNIRDAANKAMEEAPIAKPLRASSEPAPENFL